MDHEKNTDHPIEPSAESMREKSIIASSFTIEGELEAKEDTLIQGRVEGNIFAENHTVRIGKRAHVSGEIFAKRIVVEGKMKGQLSAKETIDLKQTAEVQGEVLAPNMAMEEGCQFNGKVKMDASAVPVGPTRARLKKKPSR